VKLLSDSSLRPDLIYWTLGDEEKAEEAKQMLENIQRQDRKLRFKDYCYNTGANK